MELSRPLKRFGQRSAARAAHFAQPLQRPAVKRHGERDDIFAVDILWQTERHELEMKLDQRKNANWINFNDVLRNSAFRSPKLLPGHWQRGWRTVPRPMARRHAMAGNFPN